jgi:membrane protein required for beta-lactamase induction
MSIFGIVSLLVTLALITWWLGNGIEQVQTENGTESVYQNSINAAKQAADQLGN